MCELDSYMPILDLENEPVTKFKENLKKVITFVPNNLTPVTEKDDNASGSVLDTEDQKEFDDRMNDLVNSLSDINSEFIPYNIIALTIFTTPVTDLSPIISNMSVFLLNRFETKNHERSLNNKLVKMMANIKLADTQKVHLYNSQDKTIKNLTKQSNMLEKKLNDKSQELEKQLNTKSKELENGIQDNFDKKMNALYSGFISVLGIFVAISFSLFGAVNLIHQLFSFHNGISPSEIGDRIMLSGILIILMYVLVDSLWQGVLIILKNTSHVEIGHLWTVFGLSGFIMWVGFFTG